MDGSDTMKLAARKVSIGEILKSTYVREDSWQLSYIVTERGERLLRVNVLGTVVSKQEEDTFRSILVDDGMGTIPVRSFTEENPFAQVAIGDAAIIIGKVREFSNEKYLTPEIVRKVTNPKWIELRKLELALRELNAPRHAPAPLPAEPANQQQPKDNGTAAVYEFIKGSDSGAGVSVTEISAKLAVPDVDRLVKILLEEGEIFEVRPGIVKVLE